MSDRLDSLTSWFANWEGLRALVAGAGVSGFAAADTLVELGAEVTIVTDDIDNLRANMCEVLDIDVVRSSAHDPIPDAVKTSDWDVVIVSPAYSPTHPLALWAGERDIPVWGEIELAWRVRDKVKVADWILVTGTNGKTTTTQLTAAMLSAGGFRVAPCGNIGVPVLDAVRDPEGFDVFVVELSSFQLHYARDLVPYSAVCLNVAEDHLDWHGGLDGYIAAKANVYRNTRVACVYNRADSVTRDMVEKAVVTEGARAIGFGLDSPGMSDLGVVEGILCDRAFLEDRDKRALELTTVNELRLVGLGAPHMVMNVLAASALARSYGVSPEDISLSLTTFEVDAHRHQRVAERGGVTWIDDSKATNPHAADASLLASPSVVWILGGLLKGVSLDSLIERHAARLRGAIVIGLERQPVLEAFRRHAPNVPVVDIVPDETSDVMIRAVKAAREMAQKGDVVLLAPAAASMDQFTDYADRGRRFVEAIGEE